MNTAHEENLRVFRENINKERFFEGVDKSQNPLLPFPEVSYKTVNEIGVSGESLYNHYLKSILDTGLTDIDWVNRFEESGKPYDFKISIGSDLYYVDVKCTKGKFGNVIYMSKREYLFALDTPNYYIARLYEMESDKGKLKAGDFNVSLNNLNSVLHIINIK
jgi:hypothetical protein